MRITIVGGPFQPMPPAPGGAVERIWHGLGEVFARRGHAVTVICRAYPGQQPEEAIHGVRYLRRLQFRRSRNLLLDVIKDFVYSLRVLPLLPPADVTVTNVFWLPALASLFCRRAGRIVVNVARMPKGQLFLYSWAARLAAVSVAVRDLIARQTPSVLRLVKVIPNPIPTDVFAPPPIPRPARPQEPTILYVGRVHPEKGVHLLIDAFASIAERFPSARLRVVGPSRVDQGGGGDRYVAGLRDRARRLNVEFIEPIFDPAKLVAVYHAADYFCYPSLADQGESFGLAPLEAMATGLVPIVSNLACFRDFIEPGRTGIVFDHHAKDAAERLAQALSTALADPDAAQLMGASCVAMAQRFGYEEVADLYLADFASLLASQSAAPKPGRGSGAATPAAGAEGANR